MPLYVCAGAVPPQWATHRREPGCAADLTVYPGADGTADIYEDDGVSFAYEAGKYRKIAARWYDAERRLVLTQSNPSARKLAIRIATGGASRDIVFDGREQTLHF
jgi:hypothetical protein